MCRLIFLNSERIKNIGTNETFMGYSNKTFLASMLMFQIPHMFIQCAFTDPGTPAPLSGARIDISSFLI